MSGVFLLPVKMLSFQNDNIFTGKREANILLAEDLPGAMTIETVEVLPGKETVYNFSVEDAHIFRGDDGVLMHITPHTFPEVAVAFVPRFSVAQGGAAGGWVDSLLTFLGGNSPDDFKEAIDLLSSRQP